MTTPVRDTLVDATTGPAHRPGVEEAEHRANIRRLRWVMPMATLIWVGFIPVDYLMASRIEPGPFEVYFGLRMLVLPAAVYLSVRTRQSPPISAGQLRLFGAVMFVFASWAVSVMSAFGAGPRGLYFAGVGATITARAVPLAEPYRQSIPVYAAMVVGHGVLLSGIWWARGLPADPLAVSTQLILLGAVAVLSSFGSNALWSARRQVLERTAVGRYSLVSLLGSGGMGEVWRARTAQLRRDVAVKLLPFGTETASALARFEREAATLSTLGHPHTVRIFDYGVTEDGTPFYVMELLDGEELQVRLEREGALTPETTLTIARQVCSALAEAHQLSIVHRDVKPANVFLVGGMGRAVHAKLLDFGIASLEEEAGETSGTPGYMPPEVLEGHAPRPTADVYAMGALIYRMLIGRAVFDRPTTGEVLRAHRYEPVQLPWDESYGPELLKLQQVLLRCLAKAPEDRYPDGGALLAALEALVAPEPLTEGRMVPPRRAVPTMHIDYGDSPIEE